MNQKLKDIISTIYGKKVEIEETTNLSKELSFTSIHFVQLIVEIESMFGFEFEDEEMDLSQLENAGNLNKIVCEHIGF